MPWTKATFHVSPEDVRVVLARRPLTVGEPVGFDDEMFVVTAIRADGSYDVAPHPRAAEMVAAMLDTSLPIEDGDEEGVGDWDDGTGGGRKVSTPPSTFSPWALASSAALAEADERERRRLMRPPTVGPWRQDQEGGAVFSLAHELTSEIMNALADMLDEHGAVNRVSIKGFHARAGAIECTVQRVGRLTPEDARLAAEAALRRAVALLRAAGGQWDEPLSYPPSEPPAVDGKGRVSKQPWCLFDWRTVPNLFRCERCGVTQEVPRWCDPATWEAMMVAFGATHAECREGDARP